MLEKAHDACRRSRPCVGTAVPAHATATAPPLCQIGTHGRPVPGRLGIWGVALALGGSKSVFTISREGVQDADRDGLLGANRSNSLAIARICNNADRPIPRLHTRVEIVSTL